MNSQYRTDIRLGHADQGLRSQDARIVDEDVEIAKSVKRHGDERFRILPATDVSHADFSVRAVGLAGLGALGVAFGNVLAIDEPPARRPGDFSWASVLWHEFTHTITLGATDNRVPRWVSEGLSVYEERKARPGWGQNVSPAFLKAFEEKKLVPASRLNDGFVRPAYPQQVIFSYYEASLLCEIAKNVTSLPA